MKKSKLLTKLFALVLSLLLTVPMVTGCMAGNEDEYVPEGSTVIYMSMWDSGYGVEWMENIIKAYNAKETGVYVKMDPTALRDKALLPVLSIKDSLRALLSVLGCVIVVLILLTSFDLLL